MIKLEEKDGIYYYEGKPVESVSEELTPGMLNRIDELDHITLEYISKIYGKEIDRCDIGVGEIIGSILELAVNSLNLRGYDVCYPYTADDDKCPITYLCTHCGECIKFGTGNCPYKDEQYDIIIDERKE